MKKNREEPQELLSKEVIKKSVNLQDFNEKLILQKRKRVLRNSIKYTKQNQLKQHSENKARTLKYSKLVRNRNNVQGMSIQMFNIDSLPYEIPVLYSLDMEEHMICYLIQENDTLAKKIMRTDSDSFCMDLKKIGDDINEAIRKYGRFSTGQNG